MNEVQQVNQVERYSAIENEGELQNLLFNANAMEQLYKLAQTMAESRVTVPKHLIGSVGDCMAICMQAAQWKMNPFAVAQKTHLVNGTLGYEAQLVNAVVCSSNAITGRFHYEYQGEGESMSCRVGAIPRGEQDIVWGEWLTLAFVTIRNSPLWKTNPKQQIGYLQVKNWARAFAPSAILGVYSVDEMAESPTFERDVTPVSNNHVVHQQAQEKVYIGEAEVLKILEAQKVAGVAEDYICKTAGIKSLSDLELRRVPATLAHLDSMKIDFGGEQNG